MQFHVGQSSEVVPERVPIQPLTHCNSEGSVYQRPAVVEKQIEDAWTLTSAELVERARVQDYHAPGYLQEECLVYLIRAFHRMGKTDIVNALTESLLRRCSKRVNEPFQVLDPQERDDAYHDVLQDLFDQILDLESDRGDFLQVRFWVVLKRLGISRFRRYVASQEEAKHTVPLSSLAGSERDEDDYDRRGTVPLGEVVNSSIPLERHALAQEALRLLQEPQRTAFMLRYGYGWPIEHRDPTVPSISRHFEKTPRTIRLWLSQAEETLACWRGETDDTVQ